MLHSNCQVCGNSMFSISYCGRDTDGAINPDYCSNCYKYGQFYSKDGDSHLNGAIAPFMFQAGRGGVGRGYEQ